MYKRYTQSSLHMFIQYKCTSIHIGLSVYVVMLYSAIFTQITRIIIQFDHFRYSKDKDVGMRMKPYIPSKDWSICFSSRKTNEYGTNKQLREECFHSAIFHAYYAYYYLFYFDHFRFSKNKPINMEIKPCIPCICFSSRNNSQ